MDNNLYTKKFSNVNILTDEEKASYSAFAHKVHSLDHASLFKLNNGTADTLTTEEKDIVAWEIKIRELEHLKNQGVKPEIGYSVDNYHQNVEYDPTTPDISNIRALENNRLSEMSDELFNKSKEIIENTPVVIHSNDLHSVGRGVNVLCNKYTVVDDDGNKITINNRALQEHYRKMYIKRMSDITGIDYTKYDLSGTDFPDEKYDNSNLAFDNTPSDGSYNDSTPSDISNSTPTVNINIDDYEDD